MQPQAHTRVRGRRRRTDALHSHRAPLAPLGTPSDEAVYRALLTSTEPLTPAPPVTEAASAPLAPAGDASPELDAYRALLASDAPLTPHAGGAALPVPTDLRPSAELDSYRALLASDGPLAGPPAPVEGNRATRRAAARTSHRVSRKPLVPAGLGERGRQAVVTAALVAGVGVAGVSVAAAGTARADAVATGEARTQTASHTGLSSPAEPSTIGGTAYSTAVEPEPADSDPAVAYVRTQRKVKPLPVRVPVATWVNPMPEGVVTSCFGERWGRLHAGVDLAAADGTPIRTVGAGTVVAAGPADGYGNAVLVDHGNGYLTHYGHMSVITATVGRRLKAGEQIGNEGSTGHSTGPHLHFEVHQGTYKNPIEPTQWMHDHGVDITGCVTLTNPTKP